MLPEERDERIEHLIAESDHWSPGLTIENGRLVSVERRPPCYTPLHEKRPSRLLNGALGLMILLAFGMVCFMIGFIVGFSVAF
jgi:hypothetical protein